MEQRDGLRSDISVSWDALSNEEAAPGDACALAAYDRTLDLDTTSNGDSTAT